MYFVALDVETANPNVGSICQIGLAGFEDGVLVREWETLVNPEAPFNYFFTGIHGLDAAKVAGAPVWPELAEILYGWLTGQVVVCHTLFDQRALDQAFARYGLAPLDCRWLDSCRVARQAWPALPSHKLSAVCGLIGYKFRHHDALEDAKAAGAVLLAAVKKTGLALEHWLR